MRVELGLACVASHPSGTLAVGDDVSLRNNIPFFFSAREDSALAVCDRGRG